MISTVYSFKKPSVRKILKILIIWLIVWVKVVKKQYFYFFSLFIYPIFRFHPEIIFRDIGGILDSILLPTKKPICQPPVIVTGSTSLSYYFKVAPWPLRSSSCRFWDQLFVWISKSVVQVIIFHFWQLLTESSFQFSSETTIFATTSNAKVAIVWFFHFRSEFVSLQGGSMATKNFIM